MKDVKHLLLLLLTMFLLAPAAVSAKENIDVKEILWGHIKDSYGWHVTTINDHPVVIDLPCIIKTQDGWKISLPDSSRRQPAKTACATDHTTWRSTTVMPRPIPTRSLRM